MLAGERQVALRLQRVASRVLSDEAYPRSREAHPYSLANEWTHGAHWELPEEDLVAFGAMCERLLARAVRVAETALASDVALDELALGGVRELMRRSRARAERNLIVRLDFALTPSVGAYVPWLLELNGDTPGNLVEGGLLQREWGHAIGRRTAGDAIEAQLAAAVPDALTVLHHPGDPYIVDNARWLASLSTGGRCVRYPEVPAIDFAGPVYKMFRWGRLWAGRFPEVGAWLARRETGIQEPAWGALLQHKGLLARLWEERGDLAHVLPATLAGPGALPDGGASGWAEKSFFGISGEEVAVVEPGAPAPVQLAGGAVWQARVPPLRVDGLYPIVCALMVSGRFAGALVREDDTAVSTDDIVAPIALR